MDKTRINRIIEKIRSNNLLIIDDIPFSDKHTVYLTKYCNRMDKYCIVPENYLDNDNFDFFSDDAIIQHIIYEMSRMNTY